MFSQGARLPRVDRAVRRWEPELLCWLGVHGMYRLYRAGRPAPRERLPAWRHLPGPRRKAPAWPRLSPIPEPCPRINEIARRVARRAHAARLMDRAGWRAAANLVRPKTIAPILPPSRAPELNPVEQVRQCLRQNFLANTVFETCDAIANAACKAWNKLLATPKTITSLGAPPREHAGQS